MERFDGLVKQEPTPIEKRVRVDRDMVDTKVSIKISYMTIEATSRGIRKSNQF